MQHVRTPQTRQRLLELVAADPDPATQVESAASLLHHPLDAEVAAELARLVRAGRIAPSACERLLEWPARAGVSAQSIGWRSVLEAMRDTLPAEGHVPSRVQAELNALSALLTQSR